MTGLILFRSAPFLSCCPNIFRPARARRMAHGCRGVKLFFPTSTVVVRADLLAQQLVPLRILNRTTLQIDFARTVFFRGPDAPAGPASTAEGADEKRGRPRNSREPLTFPWQFWYGENKLAWDWRGLIRKANRLSQNRTQKLDALIAAWISCLFELDNLFPAQSVLKLVGRIKTRKGAPKTPGLLVAVKAGRRFWTISSNGQPPTIQNHNQKFLRQRGQRIFLDRLMPWFLRKHRPHKYNSAWNVVRPFRERPLPTSYINNQ